jgi:hypothetical protein
VFAAVLAVATVTVRVFRSAESRAVDSVRVKLVDEEDVTDFTSAIASPQKLKPDGRVTVRVLPAGRLPADVSVTTTLVASAVDALNCVQALPPPVADEVSSEIDVTLPDDTVAAFAHGTKTNTTDASNATNAPATARRRVCGSIGRRRRGRPSS